MPTRLTEQQFKATFGASMHPVPQDSPALVDIWPYVQSVPLNDLEGHQVVDGSVEYAYRGGDQRFEHVLVNTKTRNVYLVIVVDVHAASIHGHRLLDLNREYGPA